MINFLRFSDGAKFAIVARSIFEGNGFNSIFSFWGPNLFSTSGIPRLIPYSILPFFKIFGVTDTAVIASSFFYFLLLVILVYFLGKKLFGKLVGLIASLAVVTNLNFLDYATSGASEPLFAMETVLGFYLLSLKKKWSTTLVIPVAILMYFSRPQAFVYIAGLFLYFLLLHFSFKKALTLFLSFGIIGFLVDRFVIYPLSFSYPLTPVFYRGLQSILTYSSFNAVSDSLRGGLSSTLSLADIGKKVFYNLYNFYKALPEIFNPYFIGLFVIGIFFPKEKKEDGAFKIVTVFLTFLVFLITALSIPFYRYIHPVVPLVYIFSSYILVKIIRKFVEKKYVIFTSLSLLIFFCVGITVGKYFLDSRYEARITNRGKPPVYAVLSYKLKEETEKDIVIITNLDTWGSWYGERKTVWYPLEPEMLENPKTGKVPFDAIYLTSYLMDDENYYMGSGWRQIFNDPQDIKDPLVRKNFVLKEIYSFDSNENYERQEARAVLLVKK